MHIAVLNSEFCQTLLQEQLVIFLVSLLITGLLNKKCQPRITLNLGELGDTL
jgi:hypothetical protein